MQASYGCLVGHVCMGVRVSVFAPLLCNTLVPDLDEYADGCRIQKGADWYPFCLGNPSECPPQKVDMPSKKDFLATELLSQFLFSVAGPTLLLFTLNVNKYKTIHRSFILFATQVCIEQTDG